MPAECCPTCGQAWPVAERVLSLRAAGMTAAQIAADPGVGLSERQVQRILSAAGMAQGRGRPKKSAMAASE